MAESYCLSKLDAARAFARTWNNLSTSYLEPLLADDVHYSSQNVFDEIGNKRDFLAYLEGKMNTIRTSPEHAVYAELGETRKYPMYQRPEEPCVIMAQGTKDNVLAIVLFTVDSKYISRIDMCTVAPIPTTAYRSGEYLK